MGLRIGTNVAAIAASRYINNAEKRFSHSVSSLASGSRIVRVGDDAAGFAISETLRGQVASLQMAKNNTNTGASLIQVAEGGLNEQNNILIRLRELAVQSASGTVSDEERGYLDTEFQQLVKEFDRIANTTQFGSKKLLVGTNEEFELQVGTGSGTYDSIKYRLDADTRAGTVGIDGLTVASEDDAKSSLKDIDAGLSKVIKARSGYGAIQSRLEYAGNNLDIQKENVMAARSGIVDTDVATEVTKMAQARIQSEYATAALAQANTTTERAIKLLY